ncbi:MAG: hypothetical protein WBF81_01870 [Thermoplasmata archaeon]
MGETAETFRNPYAGPPGGSSPSSDVRPTEGKNELWAFFWLTLANTTIISVAGIAAWLYVHH